MLRFAQHDRGRQVNFYIIAKVFVILNVMKDLITTQYRDFSGMPSTTRLRFAQHDRVRQVNFYIIV